MLATENTENTESLFYKEEKRKEIYVSHREH